MAEIIDAHQHCWQLRRPECRWPTPELAAIHRDFTPEDFRAETRPLGVTGSVLVQSQPHMGDTHYLLELAAAYPHILGVVGWVDLSAAGAPQQIAALAGKRELCGLRPMLQNLAPDDWILSRARPEALEAMSAHRLVFDALIDARHLPVIDALARRHPDLSIVLDHAAKPAIGEGEWRRWRDGLALLAGHDNIACKLSGLVTEMAPGQPWDDALRYVVELLALFGPGRVLWGSDWPVLNLAGDYRRWLAFSRTVVARYCPDREQAIFADNARRWYRLPATAVKKD